MTISSSCGQCGRVVRARDDLAGRKVKCPDCQAVISLPEADVGSTGPAPVTLLPVASYSRPKQKTGLDLRRLAWLGWGLGAIAGVLILAGGITWLWWHFTTTAPRTFALHAGAVLGVAVSPDGHRGFSAGEDGSLRVWDLATGQVVWRLTGHTGSALRVGFAADGRRAFTFDMNYDLRRWDLEQGTSTIIFKERDGTYLEWPRGGRVVLACGNPEVWQRYDVFEDKRMTDAKGRRLGPTYSINISADGRIAMICFQTSATRQQTLGEGGRVTSDSTSLGEPAAAVVWDMVAGQEVRRFQVPGRDIVELIVSPDGRRGLTREASPGQGLVIGGDTEERYETSPEMRWFDMETGKELGVWEGHKAPVRAVAFTADGRHVLSGSDDGEVLLWDAATGKVRQRTSAAGSVRCLTFTPDGHWAVIGDKEGNVALRHLSR